MNDPLVLLRAVHMLATMLVTGVLFFGAFVAAPALGAGTATLPARLRAYSRALVALGLALAFVSGAAWFALLAARIGEASSLEAFADAALTLLKETEFGTAWLIRLVLALVLAIALLRREGLPSRYDVTLVAGALFAGALAWSGHSAATPGDIGYVHLAADFLHLVAAAVWLGSLAPLAMLLRWLGPSIDRQGVQTLSMVLRRYSDLGLAAVATLIVTGIANVLFIPGRLDATLASDYGRVLLAKLVLFAIMLIVAAINRQKLTPMLASGTAGDAAAIVRRLRLNVLAEIALGIGIVTLVGWLGIMVPGEVADPHAHMH